MASVYPPELKGFHTRNMLHALLVFTVPVVAGGWGFYRQETFAANDDLQSVLSWIFMGGVGAFMIMILIKALVTLPKCPKCNQKMQQLETIEIEQKQMLGCKESTRWRVVHCQCCDSRYRIPGLS